MLTHENTLRPLPSAIKADIAKINSNLLNALYMADANIPPHQRLEIIKHELINSLQLLPVANYSEIVKYL